MANEIVPTNEYPLPKDSYAAFDAISLRNLIIQRMNDQGIYTDQNYIGSNLAAIIDIISYSFNTLMFYLNRTSTESIFTEAQLYENISRIVKLLDYKPIGYQTSTLAFQCSAQNLNAGFYTIPRYTYLTVAGVPFSFNEDVSFAISTDPQAVELTDLTNKKLLYQGIYRENPLYRASGDPNEVVTINVSNIFVDHFNIDVYVYESRQNRWVQYANVPTLYTEQAFSRSFEKRLNSDLLYEVTFGDGINGRKLEENDQVAIYYLQSSGQQGIIGPGEISTGTKSIFNTSTFGPLLTEVNNEQFTYLNTNQLNNLFFNNVVGSTVPKDIETADDIRKNAPANFKSQYRLVTKEDYETFIRTNFSNFINDVRVFSNWDYTSDYLKYFNDIQVSPTSFRQILLNQIAYADSCNFNNVYICCVPKVSQQSTLKYLLPAQKEIIKSNIDSLKTLTSEITFLDPVFKAVSIGVKTNDEVVVSDKDFCRLEIIRSTNNKRSTRSIASEVETIFKDFFNPTNATLGGLFEYSSLAKSILAVDGVSKIITRRLDTDETFNGLSLFMWNPSYPDLDKQSIVNDIEMKDFEFVYYDNLQSVFSQIEVLEQETDKVI
jgi:hypothetical protein